MTNLKTISIPSLLQELEIHLNKLNYGEQPEELYQPITYIMQLGGKRIRPLLTLLAYSLFKEDYEKILTPAAAVEVFHNFTLMHDDIMDQAPLRRGMPTVHEKWNANTAILSGDVMLVRAYDMLLKVEQQYLLECLSQFNKTAAEVCEGQQMDMNFETREMVHEDEYLEMIRQKTAVLLGFSLQLGAILAGASKQDAQALYSFGVNVGIGFQLKDDLLDVYADKAKFGKQVGGDILSNKKTFLLIKAMELTKGSDAEQLNTWLSKKEANPGEKVQAVTALYDSYQIKSITEQKMGQYFDQGFAQLKSLEVNFTENLLILEQLTKDLIDREK